MLFCLVIGATMGAAAWQSDTAFRLYGTPKFIGAKHLLLAVGVMIAFGVGSRLATVTGKRSKVTPAAVAIDGRIQIWFWISFALTTFGYAAWLAVGVKNGFSIAVLRELLTTDDPLFAENLHKDMFNTIQGVTTCTQFGVAAVPMGVWLFFRGQRNVIGAIASMFGLAMVRAIVFSERLAVIELLVPATIVTLRMQFLGHRCSRSRRWLFELAPVAGVIALVLFFGAFEYFRSWRYYRYEFDSYPQFVVWRVAGYYTTAHNNSAMALETRPLYPVPFTTVQSLWTLVGMANQSLRYQNLTGVDPDTRHQTMLEQFGTPELNNEGGLFQPALDYGVAGMLVFWFACGFAAARGYRSFLTGNFAGIMLYSLLFLSILETPRFLYLTYTRSLPPLAMLVLVSVVAVYGKKRVPEWDALPATA
jgi:hypothetical protein